MSAPPTSEAAASVLEELNDLQSAHSLSILRLTEPIASTNTPSSPSTRRTANRHSDASAHAFDDTDDLGTPSALAADLAHYKELFAKLRFSYVEQVTKEKYLRAIVGDPPLLVSHQENVEFEGELAEMKRELKGKKEEVGRILEEMEETGRQLARRYEQITLQQTTLSTLPESIANLETSIAAHKETLAAHSSAQTTSDIPSQNLPLPQTLSLLSERTSTLESLDREIALLQSKLLPKKQREAENAERELAGLEKRKSEAVAAALEARRRKESGEGDAEGVENRGRWYRGAERVLAGVVE